MVNKKSELSALLSSAALVMVGGVAASVAKLGERVVIGRLLSPDAYGEVSIGLAVLTLTTTIALAGCTQGISRFVPRYDHIEDRRGVWISGLLVTTAISLAMAAAILVFAESIAAALFETEEAVVFIRILALSLPFIIGFRVAVSVLRGYENTIYRTIVHDFLDPALRIGLIALLLLAGFGIAAAGIAYLLAAVVTFVVAHLFLRRLMPLTGSFQTHTRELLRFSAPLVVSTVVSVMLSQTDTLMLGYFRSSAEVGLYDAAYPIAGGLTVILSAFGFLYLPIASRLESDDELDAVDDIYATTTKWVYVVTFPAFLLLVAFPEDVITVFFGPSFSDAATVLPILAVGFFLSAAAGRDRETLSAIGATTWIAIGNVVGLTLNIIVNILLIPQYGFLGAGVASVLSLITVHGIVCGILAINYGITPLSSKANRCYVGLPLVLLPLGFLASSFVTLSGILLLPFLVVAGIASLIVIAIVGGFEGADIVIIDLLEDTTGLSIPFVRRVIPETGSEAVEKFGAD